MTSNPRRIVRSTSLLLLSGLAAACGQAGPSFLGQDSQPITGASALISHSKGTVLVNGRPYALDATLESTKGTFRGTINEALEGRPLIPPDWWFLPNIMVKAHTRGVFVDYVARTVGDTASVRLDLGQLGWLNETTTVVSESPLRYEHVFQGSMVLPEGDVPLLPWAKADMHFLYAANGTVTGSAVLRGTVLRGQEQVQVSYPVKYSGTFSAQPVARLPLEINADVQFRHYDPCTGAFFGTEDVKASKPRP